MLHRFFLQRIFWQIAFYVSLEALYDNLGLLNNSLKTFHISLVVNIPFLGFIWQSRGLLLQSRGFI